MQNMRAGVVPQMHLTNRRICSSLLLQQLIYYNTYYSLAWFLTKSILICSRYIYGLNVNDPDKVRTVMMAFFIPAEPIRLLCGFAGNLQENVPLVAFFLVLTIFPSSPICLYLLFGQKWKTPIDTAIQIVMTVFLFSEMIVGVSAIGRMVGAQKKQFYLHDFVIKREGHDS
uniref:Transmembrane protein n=1 Tax=Tetraselmis chuii TaxID=63592 RepID=A0A7S1SM40_9CHLO|mmetsp:Transcript_19345/g.34500  ORF Transcript_19345/g.34500 Transcript_19345/m.34500 type:complete len:171 (+) Transcript_19345:63-575(+)|eukprot:CAMPEP_0177764040 /NCGR_PEP_ID=MMETSP0491_2-20121128/7185_1 /TAXON_ID=63592 /ORGANISM="Tetraselmis chuii, Strain PLY429" /LENGTH=170 /DNA_ID=CAMNT_0019280173 /DNA_START=258 /DNA_END=770 /DNA_ORIENTATION=+